MPILVSILGVSDTPSPSPPVYWNHQVAAKILFDLWAPTSYGQNLEPQGLSLGRARFSVVQSPPRFSDMRAVDDKVGRHREWKVGCGKIREVLGRSFFEGCVVS
jgi:hypothetical protein